MAYSAFQFVLFLYYICIGASTIIVVKYSETSSGKLVYNTATAIFCVPEGQEGAPAVGQDRDRHRGGS